MWALAILAPLVIVAGAAWIAGDLRITKKEQREWEEYWAQFTSEERDRAARFLHGI